MSLALDIDLRAHLENHLTQLVSYYVENKLKRFGLYRRTTVHTGTTVAQRTFGDKIKCIDTLLRESGKLLASRLPITSLSRDETYEIHLKDILKSEWSKYGILVINSGGQRHQEYYISAFLSVADVRTSVQKIYHKSRLEMYEELQIAIKIMPSVNGRRPCCSRTNREELYRLNCFADHMSLMKKLFCVESGLDTRSFLKNEDGPYRYDPTYSTHDPEYDSSIDSLNASPYGPWKNLVESLHFLVSDEASCMRMIHEYYTSTAGQFDFLVHYLNETPARGNFISDIYHHPCMAVLELLRVAGPDINLLRDDSPQSQGSLCSIDLFFKEVGIDLLSTITYFLQKMVLFGGTINSETSLKDFFYPETGIYRFKPGEGLSRCTRYVVEDLTSAFPCSTDGNEKKYSVESRRTFQIIALLSKFFTATREVISESPLQPPDKNFDLRGSSLDFDPDIQSVPSAPAPTPPSAFVPPSAATQARRRGPLNSNGNNSNGNNNNNIGNHSSSSSQSNSNKNEPHLQQDYQSSPVDCSHSAPHTLSSNSSTDSIQNGKESPDSPDNHLKQNSHSNSHSNSLSNSHSNSLSHSNSHSRSHHSPLPNRSDLRNSEDHDQGHNGRSSATPTQPGHHQQQQHHSDNDINHSSSNSNSNTTSIPTPPEPPNQRAIAVVLASIKDFGNAIPTPLNSTVSLIAMMGEGDEFQDTDPRSQGGEMFESVMKGTDTDRTCEESNNHKNGIGEDYCTSSNNNRKQETNAHEIEHTIGNNNLGYNNTFSNHHPIYKTTQHINTIDKETSLEVVGEVDSDYPTHILDGNPTFTEHDCSSQFPNEVPTISSNVSDVRLFLDSGHLTESDQEQSTRKKTKYTD